jgi:hypothetical protein
VVQCEWTAKNLRATLKNSTSVDDVMYSRMIAHPFRLLMCCDRWGRSVDPYVGGPRQGLRSARPLDKGGCPLLK